MEWFLVIFVIAAIGLWVGYMIGKGKEVTSETPPPLSPEGRKRKIFVMGPRAAGKSLFLKHLVGDIPNEILPATRALERVDYDGLILQDAAGENHQDHGQPAQLQNFLATGDYCDGVAFVFSLSNKECPRSYVTDVRRPANEMTESLFLLKAIFENPFAFQGQGNKVLRFMVFFNKIDKIGNLEIANILIDLFNSVLTIDNNHVGDIVEQNTELKSKINTICKDWLISPACIPTEDEAFSFLSDLVRVIHKMQSVIKASFDRDPSMKGNAQLSIVFGSLFPNGDSYPDPENAREALTKTLPVFYGNISSLRYQTLAMMIRYTN